MAKKKRKSFIVILLLLIAALVIGVLFFLYLRPGLADTTACAVYIKALSEDKTLQMNMNVTASADQNDLDLDLTMTRTQTGEDSDLMVVEMDGICFYYSDGILYLENGSAWSLAEDSPDFDSLPEILMTVCENADVEHYEENSYTCYRFSATEENASVLMKYLCPTVAQEIISADDLQVIVKVLDHAVSEIDLSGKGSLGRDTDLKVSAVVTVVPESSRTTPDIPQEITQAISSGAGENAAVITSDMLNLLKAWGKTLTANPFTSQITLGADCGLFSLDTDFTYTRTTAEDETVTYAIEAYGQTIYFDDNGQVWDSNHNQVTDDDLSDLTDSAKLIDLAYQLCMTTQSEVQEGADGSRTYTLTLDDDTMQEIVNDIAPALKDSHISFEDGTVTMTSDGSRITDASIRCTGSIDALITEISAVLYAEMVFPE